MLPKFQNKFLSLLLMMWAAAVAYLATEVFAIVRNEVRLTMLTFSYKKFPSVHKVCASTSQLQLFLQTATLHAG